MTDLERLRELRKKATLGPFEYRIGDDLDRMRQVPCVIGAGLVGRSYVARFADDPEGHADAQLYAALVNFFDLPSTQAMLEAGEGEQNAAPQEVKSGKAETAQFSSGNQTEGTPSTTRLERSEITGPAVAAPDYEELCGRLEQISDEALARYVLKNLTLFNRDANLFYLTGIFQEVRRTAAERLRRSTAVETQTQGEVMKFPKQIYVKREDNDKESWLIAQETVKGIVEADETEDVAIYQLLRVTKVSAPTKLK